MVVGAVSNPLIIYPIIDSLTLEGISEVVEMGLGDLGLSVARGRVGQWEMLKCRVFLFSVKGLGISSH